MMAQTEQGVVTRQSSGVRILCIAGPTASGKSSRAVAEAHARNGEIISVDSRQIYRGLDIGTEKISSEEMQGIPHHLIDIRDPNESYSAGDFVADAERLIAEITARGKLPILVGGTHFYFDALLHGLGSEVAMNAGLREQLEQLSTDELYARVAQSDPRRARELDPHNRRRLIRALEIIEHLGTVPPRGSTKPPPGTRLNLVPDKASKSAMDLVSRFNLDTEYPLIPTTAGIRGYSVEWMVIDPPREELRARIDARLESALARGLVDEVRRVRAQVGDVRLNELGLEYKVVGEYLRGEREESTLLPALSAKLWQYARRQKAWLRKLEPLTRDISSPQ